MKPYNYVKRQFPEFAHLEVDDSKKRLGIMVLKCHSDKGIPGHARLCAVALAGEDKGWALAVYSSIVYGHKIGTKKLLKFVPAKGTKLQIGGFDKTRVFIPGKVILEPPKPYETIKASRLSKKKYKAKVKAGHVPKPRKGSKANPDMARAISTSVK